MYNSQRLSYNIVIHKVNETKYWTDVFLSNRQSLNIVSQPKYLSEFLKPVVTTNKIRPSLCFTRRDLKKNCMMTCTEIKTIFLHLLVSNPTKPNSIGCTPITVVLKHTSCENCVCIRTPFTSASHQTAIYFIGRCYYYYCYYYYYYYNLTSIGSCSNHPKS